MGYRKKLVSVFRDRDRYGIGVGSVFSGICSSLNLKPKLDQSSGSRISRC
ncbi:hypothetical protein Hanom_Chr04g00357611 [Helianthus anomalus]